MVAGSEWISPLLNEPTHPLLESTWDGPHMVAVAAVVVHHAVSPGTTIGAMSEDMTEAMIVTMIAMMTETTTDHTGADLHLLTTEEEGTALDPGLGPIHHVTTEQQGSIQQNVQSFRLS